MKSTQNQNYIKKPSCFAREPQDEFPYELRISPGTSKEYKNIKGIKVCHECKSNNIKYDNKHDEIYCDNCGLVLRQALTDYTPYNPIVLSHAEEEKINTKKYNPKIEGD
jgi:hypothetical protein